MRRLLLILISALWALMSVPVQAHPHIWIDARISVIFDQAGAISALRHEWTFDQAFSSWSIQGLDVDGDGTVSDAEFQALAEENMVGLKEYAFYTFAGSGAENMAFLPGTDPKMRYDGARTTLSFTLPVETPTPVSGDVEIEVTDPEYYAAFTFLTDRGVTLENAPANCSAEINAPKAIDPEMEQALAELGADITELPDALKGAAADLANVVIVRCGDGTPLAVTSDATTAQPATPKAPSPFAAPPAERGLPVVRDGFLGWVFAQQKMFYAALTEALGRLKSDGHAFWVLGGLSFLYGVFHAAGPGHGKIVVSTYVLATETQRRRGIVLSFASALVQAITAIVFVSVAALVFKMTSVGLSQMSGLLVNGSYLLIIALGCWLVFKKLWSYWRGRTAEPVAQVEHNHGDHHHVGDHACHVVSPTVASGGWREMLGVVLAVGLRPCSGALVVLVFALSQGVFAAGVIAVVLMAVGTGITVALLATLVVSAKRLGGLFDGGPYAEIVASMVWWLEFFGAILVLAFGLVLFLAGI